MMSELTSWLKSTKLAPLKPAPTTSSAPKTDHARTGQLGTAKERAAAPITKTASTSPNVAWMASAAAPCVTAHPTLLAEPLT
jgi:hypothetical protein